MKSGIYRITCTANGKVYIGSAQNLKKRWNSHRCYLRMNKHHSRYLQSAWNKYGEECFVWEVIEHVEDARLTEREQHYIDLCQSSKKEHGFNMNPNATSGVGHVLTDESKEKIRRNRHPNSKAALLATHEANKGRKHSPEQIKNRVESRRNGAGFSQSPETKEKIRAANLGKTTSPETREKMSTAAKGRQISDETKEKISAAAKGRQISDETKEKLRVAMTGRQLTDEWRAKIAASNRKTKQRQRAERRRQILECRAEHTFLRTGIKPDPIIDPPEEHQGTLFDFE